MGHFFGTPCTRYKDRLFVLERVSRRLRNTESYQELGTPLLDRNFQTSRRKMFFEEEKTSNIKFISGRKALLMLMNFLTLNLVNTAFNSDELLCQITTIPGYNLVIGRSAYKIHLT